MVCILPDKIVFFEVNVAAVKTAMSSWIPGNATTKAHREHSIRISTSYIQTMLLSSCVSFCLFVFVYLFIFLLSTYLPFSSVCLFVETNFS